MLAFLKKLNKKYPITFLFAIISLCLVLISSYFTGGLYARYISTATPSGDAHIARFEIDSNLYSEDTVIDLGVIKPGFVSDEITITVENKSQVSVEYIFSVNSSGNLPLTYTFSNDGAGRLLIGGEQSASHTLVISWDENENDYRYASEFDVVSVSLTVTQIN